MKVSCPVQFPGMGQKKSRYFLVFTRLPFAAALAVAMALWAQDGSLPVTPTASREVVISADVLRRTSTIVLPECAGSNSYGRSSPCYQPESAEKDDYVTGLRAREFHLYQDNVKQKIRAVTMQRQRAWIVFDSLPFHREWANTPRGTWSGPDLGETISADSHPRQAPGYTYFVSYVPPASPEGWCHELRLDVDQSDARVVARRQYCNTDHSASDLMDGTRNGLSLGNYAIGRNPDEYASPGESLEIPVAAQVVPTFASAQQDRINIAIEFPWQGIRSKLKNCYLDATVSLVGLVLRDDVLVTRFSDVSNVENKHISFKSTGSDCDEIRNSGAYAANVPTRYVTQVDLQPGLYTLKVAIADGETFGRVEVPVRVEAHNRQKLDLSGVVLCKRFRIVPDPAKDEQDRALEYVPLISRGIQVTPTGETRFARSDRLLAYFEVLRRHAAAIPRTVSACERESWMRRQDRK